MRKGIKIMIIWVCFLFVSFPIKAGAVDKKSVETITSQGKQTISDITFQEMFRDYICQNLGKEKSDVMVSRWKVLGNKPVCGGKINLRLFQKDKRRLEGYVRLVAIVSANGIVKNKVTLSGWVDVYGSVVCARRNLKKGEIIEEDDLYSARKNISHLSSKILTDTGRAVGLMPKHTIQKDACIKGWMLERPLVVKRGDMVSILAESGNLRVTVLGKILVKGHMGELVRVRNSMSKKVIYARVINNSTVSVDF